MRFARTVVSQFLNNRIYRYNNFCALLYKEFKWIQKNSFIAKLYILQIAQQFIFLYRYHDLDDEPTCPRFSYDIESIPAERAVLKEHISKEILQYHTKRPKPKLAPVQTEFLKPFTSPASRVQVVGVSENTKTVIGTFSSRDS